MKGRHIRKAAMMFSGVPLYCPYDSSKAEFCIIHKACLTSLALWQVYFFLRFNVLHFIIKPPLSCFSSQLKCDKNVMQFSQQAEQVNIS